METFTPAAATDPLAVTSNRTPGGYYITVTNTGSEPITNFGVTGSPGIVPTPPSTIPQGGSFGFTIPSSTEVVSLTFSGVSNGDPFSVVETFEPVDLPLQVTSLRIPVGFQVTATNTGTSTITNLMVFGGTPNLPPPQSLEPGESYVFNVSVTSVENVTLAFVGISDGEIFVTTENLIPLTPSPALSFTKSGFCVPHTDQAVWMFVIKNTGSVPLTNITINESTPDITPIFNGGIPPTTIFPGESISAIAYAMYKPGVTNTAQVSAMYNNLEVLSNVSIARIGECGGKPSRGYGELLSGKNLLYALVALLMITAIGFLLYSNRDSRRTPVDFDF